MGREQRRVKPPDEIYKERVTLQGLSAIGRWMTRHRRIALVCWTTIIPPIYLGLGACTGLWNGLRDGWLGWRRDWLWFRDATR